MGVRGWLRLRLTGRLSLGRSLDDVDRASIPLARKSACSERVTREAVSEFLALQSDSGYYRWSGRLVAKLKWAEDCGEASR
jgi:hypothetical protein